jgi:hypothetical protein
MKYPIFAVVIGGFLVEAINLMAARDYDNAVAMLAAVLLLCLASALFEAWESNAGRRK